jgi:hypothetical protein
VVNSGSLAGCYNVTNEHARPKFATVILEGYTIPNQCIFEKIEEFGIDIPEDLKYCPYRATYDIKAMLEPTERPKSNKMEWTSTHVPLSISICSSIPDHDRPIYFVSKRDPNVVIANAVKYLKSLSRTAQMLLLERYQELFEEMEITLTQKTTKKENILYTNYSFN